MYLHHTIIKVAHDRLRLHNIRLAVTEMNFKIQIEFIAMNACNATTWNAENSNEKLNIY